MFKEIPKSDIVVRPIKVYKEWVLDENDISPIFGKDDGYVLFDPEDPGEMSNGIDKRVFYASIKSQFYRNPETSSVMTEVGLRKSYASKDERVLESNLAVLPIPQKYYGDGIKIGTVVLEDETLGRTYTDDGYSNLIDSGSNIKGNIFYDRGLVVVTKDIVSGSVLSQFTLNYRSTKTIFENEVFLSVLENEYNYSQNPSAVIEDGGKRSQIRVTNPWDPSGKTFVSASIWESGIRYIRNKKRPFTSSFNPTKFGSFDDYMENNTNDRTGSFIAPFITTIGLYDNELNMVAVAKLPVPIKSLPDYPVNFIIRFDT
jgi:hypothetical protein